MTAHFRFSESGEDRARPAFSALCAAALSLSLSAAAFFSTFTALPASAAPITIESQESFAVGGVVIPALEAYDPMHPKTETQDLHTDHAFVRYQIPVNARRIPLMFLHGHGQFSKSWETTPDGRDGFQSIFLARG